MGWEVVASHHSQHDTGETCRNTSQNQIEQKAYTGGTCIDTSRKCQAGTARMLEDLLREAGAYSASVESDEQVMSSCRRCNLFIQDGAGGCDVPSLPT